MLFYVLSDMYPTAVESLFFALSSNSFFFGTLKSYKLTYNSQARWILSHTYCLIEKEPWKFVALLHAD